MKSKEIIFMFGLFIVIFCSLFLIPDNPKSKTLLKTPSPIAWAQIKDNPEKELTISWLGMPGYMGGKSSSWLEQNLNMRFKIKLDPIFMDHNAYLRRRPLLLANGNIPDVMWVSPPLMARTHVKNNFVMELPYDVIGKYAPTYVKLLNNYAKEAWLQCRYKGKNFGLPTFFIEALRPTIGGWRGDWLKNVGINKVPETLDEMEVALFRFRNNDPDGNGLKDTYGYCPNLSSWAVSYTEAFLPHDILPFDFVKRNGRVTWGGILPEAKMVLKRLRKWYENGLIDPDYILTARSNSMATKFLNGKTGFIYPCYKWNSYDPNEPNSDYSKLKALNSKAVLVAAKPLIAKSGKRRGRSWGAAGHILQFGKHLEKEPEKVIRVLKMLEAIAREEELLLQATHGEYKVHWNYNTDKGIYLLPPFDKDLVLQKQQLLRANSEGCLFYFPSGIMPLYPKYIKSKEKTFNTAYRNPEWSFVNVIGKTEVLPSAGQYAKDLIAYQQKIYAEIICGDIELDYFDDFVKTFKRRGGDILIREANELYNQSNQVYQDINQAAGEHNESL